MTDQIDPTRSFKPVAGPRNEESVQRQKQEKTRAGGEDRVSLNQSEPVEPTYAPQSPLNIGSNYELLRSLVVKTLQEQNVPLQISIGNTTIDLNTLSVEDAQKLVSEDGYFGVKQTSDRIVDFAINAFGNDPTRLDEMKKAIDQGFQDAQHALGGTLPDISQQTYDAIMQKLDDFAAQFDQSGE